MATQAPIDLQTNDWTLLGVAPMFVQSLNPRNAVRWVAAPTKPTDKALAGHIIGGTGYSPDADIGADGQNIYAIALGSSNTVIVTV